MLAVQVVQAQAVRLNINPPIARTPRILMMIVVVFLGVMNKTIDLTGKVIDKNVKLGGVIKASGQEMRGADGTGTSATRQVVD